MSTPRIERRVEQPYVGIRARATLLEWPRVNALVGTVFRWLEEHDVEWAGPPFYRYWIIGDEQEEFDLEVGVPVDSLPAPEPPIHLGAMPGASYVQAIHYGHPDQLELTHEAVRAWAEVEGVELKKNIRDGTEVWSGLFEIYLSNPTAEPDLHAWRTEVLYQMVDGQGR